MLRRSLGVFDANALCMGPGSSFRVTILCSLWYTEKFVFWMELDSGSHDGEHNIVDQMYGEAWLMSMVKVRFQNHEPGLGLG